MTINERIRYLRKDILKLNQTDFAEAIGMKQRGASGMEKNGATVTDKTIKTICLVFNISENWLRNGIEPMHIQPSTFNLDEFVKKHSTSEDEYQTLLDLLKTYFDIDENIRKALVQYFKEYIANRAKPVEQITKKERGKTFENLTKEEKIELYKEGLEIEEKGTEKLKA